MVAYGRLGLIYRRQGRLSQAMESYESALKLAPHPGLYHNLGMTLMSKAEEDQKQGNTAAVGEDVRKARAAFEKALSFENESEGTTYLAEWSPAKTHALLGQVLISLGDRAGARQHLQMALQMEPTGPIADVTRRQLQKVSQ